jgi:hypothetical protein
MFPTLQVNQAFIETGEWLVQLATLFGNNDREVIKKEMNRMTFTANEIDAVVFLKRLLEFKPEDVFDTYRELERSGIDKKSVMEFAKINRLDLKLIKALLQYKPTTDGNEVMRLYGVKGPEIGEKIKELEAEKFILKLS